MAEYGQSVDGGTAALGIRFRPLILLASATALVACVSCTGEASLGRGHYRWEGIQGFAIWPEDHPEDGLAACEERVDAQAWRRDPTATAERFARSVLNWRQPPDLGAENVPAGAPRTAFSMSDGSMPKWALGVVVHLRQLRGCWFVAAVWPRDGGIAAEYRWMKRRGEPALRATWKGSSAINLEVGWGDHVERKRLRRGQSVTIPAPDPRRPGHILWFHDDPSENTLGQPLSPALTSSTT
jgi:hypothetical protein